MDSYESELRAQAAFILAELSGVGEAARLTSPHKRAVIKELVGNLGAEMVKIAESL